MTASSPTWSLPRWWSLRAKKATSNPRRKAAAWVTGAGKMTSPRSVRALEPLNQLKLIDGM
jgi:hypothetical protein